MNRLKLTALLPLLAACATTSGAQQEPSAPGAETIATTQAASEGLDRALAGSWREEKNVARDPARHPKETLTFFGVQPDQTVIEITPGAGWYAEVLAPYLAAEGQYVAAIVDDAAASEMYRKMNQSLRDRLTADAATFGSPELRAFDPAAPSFGPAGSADVVLTFRNAHNWVKTGSAPGFFQAFFDVLKPGGVLGVVDHRAVPGTPKEVTDKSGYVTEAAIIEVAKAAGFELASQSEINANPRDTTDHPNGVWSLPPSNRHEPADAEKYKAIGESDRMTLRFVKPQG